MENGRDAVEVFKALFITGRNIWLVGGAWALLFLCGIGLPKHWKKHYRENVVPYFSLVICSAAVWIPGLHPGLPEGHGEVAGIDGTEIGFRIMLGFMLAVAAYLAPWIYYALLKKVLPASTAATLEKVIRKVW